jgi:hypothetical protein
MIDAEPEVVFPLLCPVREADWLDGWKYEMVYSASGFAEQGCVFITPGEGEPDTVWVITKHDREERVIEFSRVTPGSRTCVLVIFVEPKGAGTSAVNITYTYTSISEKGNQFLEGLTEDKFLVDVRFWEESMNFYLKTGALLKSQ